MADSAANPIDFCCGGRPRKFYQNAAAIELVRRRAEVRWEISPHRCAMTTHRNDSQRIWFFLVLGFPGNSKISCFGLFLEVLVLGDLSFDATNRHTFHM